MKKSFVFFLTISIIFLWGCESGKLMNDTIFADRFNKACENYAIDKENITSQNIDGVIKYSYILSSENSTEKYLISLYAAPDNLNIRSCSVTFVFGNTDNKNKSKTINIDKISLEQLMQITSAAIQAYTKQSPEYAAGLLKNLGLDNTKKTLAKGSKYKEEQWYRYSLITNNIGVTFNIESVTLCSTTETDLTLRN